MCRLAELTVLGGAVVATGRAVGAAVVGAAPDTAVGAAGALVAAGADVAVADEPQATINTRSMEISTAGFLRAESFMTCPPNVGTPSDFQVAVREGRVIPQPNIYDLRQHLPNIRRVLVIAYRIRQIHTDH